MEQFWNPLLYIDNILSETKETQWMMAQRNDAGEVYLLERRRIKGLFLETLELNDFPLDVQVSLFCDQERSVVIKHKFSIQKEIPVQNVCPQ